MMVGARSTRLTGVWQTCPAAHIRSGNDHRHARGIVVVRALSPHAARADVVAVVAGVDDARRLGEAGALQRLDDPAYLAIDPRAQAVVASGRQAAPLLVERIVDRVHAVAGLQPGMAGMPILWDADAAVAFFRRDRGRECPLARVSGKCGATKPTNSTQGRSWFSSRRARDPGLGLRGDAVVIDIVLGCAGPDRVQHHVCALGEVRLAVAQRAPDHAVAAVDVHRVILVVEARRVFRVASSAACRWNRPDGRSAAGRGPSPGRVRRRRWHCPRCRGRARSGQWQRRRARERKWASCNRRRRSACRAPPGDRGWA